MNHCMNEWMFEQEKMKNALLKRSDSEFDLTFHVFNERMEQRDISIIEIAQIILNGVILGGWDVLQYPHYKNKNMLRTIVGETNDGRLLSVGIAFDDYKKFKVTTVYEGIKKDLIQNFKVIAPNIYLKHESVIAPTCNSVFETIEIN